MGAKLFGFFVGVLMATTCIWGSGIFDIACASSTWSMDDILSNDIGGLGYKYVPTSYVKSSNGNSAAVLCYNDDDQKYAVKWHLDDSQVTPNGKWFWRVNSVVYSVDSNGVETPLSQYVTPEDRISGSEKREGYIMGESKGARAVLSLPDNLLSALGLHSNNDLLIGGSSVQMCLPKVGYYLSPTESMAYVIPAETSVSWKTDSEDVSNLQLADSKVKIIYVGQYSMYHLTKYNDMDASYMVVGDYNKKAMTVVHMKSDTTYIIQRIANIAAIDIIDVNQDAYSMSALSIPPLAVTVVVPSYGTDFIALGESRQFEASASGNEVVRLLYEEISLGAIQTDSGTEQLVWRFEAVLVHVNTDRIEDVKTVKLLIDAALTIGGIIQSIAGGPIGFVAFVIEYACIEAPVSYFFDILLEGILYDIFTAEYGLINDKCKVTFTPTINIVTFYGRNYGYDTLDYWESGHGPRDWSWYRVQVSASNFETISIETDVSSSNIYVNYNTGTYPYIDIGDFWSSSRSSSKITFSVARNQGNFLKIDRCLQPMSDHSLKLNFNIYIPVDYEYNLDDVLEILNSVNSQQVDEGNTTHVQSLALDAVQLQLSENQVWRATGTVKTSTTDPITADPSEKTVTVYYTTP